MNAFEIFAKISLDTNEYERNLSSAEKTSLNFANKIGSGFKTIGKMAATGFAAAATGIGFLTKASVDGYAEYEQLTGGVETLFKTSADQVMEYADNAYKTAGMSANEYMDTVTSFSASLLQGLGGDTQKAAEYANTAITDMSDNANKMGTSMEMIQNAYQGFAKQNYTMLDNLKLGYGGTQEEMIRLINDSGILNEEISSLDGITFDQIVSAIHEVQTNMGITGTTAKEASTTIEGSINSMKSAWSNLITGIADDNANLDVLITNFTDSIATVGENLIPRIEQIFSGIGTAVQNLAPVIAESLPSLIENVLPGLLDAATTLFTSIGQALPELISTLIPVVLETITTILPEFLGIGVQILTSIIEGITSALPNLLAQIPVMIENVVSTLALEGPKLLQAGMDLLKQIASGIEQYLPQFIGGLPQIISSFVDFITTNLPTILDQGVQILNSLINGIINSIPEFIANLPKIITSFVNFIVQSLPQIIEAGVNILVNLITGIIKAIPQLIASLPQIIMAIVQGLGNLLGSILDIGVNIVQALWNGISSAIGWLWDQITGWVGGIIDGIKGLLGIHSPSRVFKDFGKNMALGLGDGWGKEIKDVKSDIESDMVFDGGYVSSTIGSGYSGSSSNPLQNNITININGAKYQDEQSLAEAISYELQKLTTRKGSVYA